MNSGSSIFFVKFNFRILASLFADLAKVHAPKQIWALVGGFLLLRFVYTGIS